MSNKIKVSTPDANWNNDHLQFARFIAELQAVDAISNRVIADLSDSMDLTHAEIHNIIDRACDAWDDVVSRT